MPNSLNLLHENCVADSEGNCLGDLKSESVNKKLQYKRSHDKLSIHPCSKKDVVDDKLPNEVGTTPHFQRDFLPLDVHQGIFPISASLKHHMEQPLHSF